MCHAAKVYWWDPMFVPILLLWYVTYGMPMLYNCPINSQKSLFLTLTFLRYKIILENQIFHSFTQNMEKLPNMSRNDRKIQEDTSYSLSYNKILFIGATKKGLLIQVEVIFSISLVLRGPQRVGKMQLRPLKLKNTRKNKNLLTNVLKEVLKTFATLFVASFIPKRGFSVGFFSIKH